ncbi:MAG TPA: type II toxin-antitoxin system VapC family toxin [Leptospiraceae bacterium]|nr:type II toxin-antitoxin system VapC family toxin [Leptospiraceae bacterium]HMW04593.1 type II toxin-antitoxin system VapC family toxin [Leptospiraceae bacterium]HMX33254.1 type II toxin-antitoxin system VapC family toxin [Leptospiraceae bacterium]HMY30779.1 type II toxin-antitoxin system VapC family toxin [Leptospiraceae bacterium]HMZ66725.1 type II toxin-antitoxin system VapC family toxin [Leptospiraceae bacterium]
MNQYLLDTNICIYIINKRPDSVYKKFKKINLDNIFISVITDFELRYGVEKSQRSEKNFQILEEFLGYLNVLPLETSDSMIAGALKNRLEKKGELIGPYDLLIASQAISRDLVLVTNNEKEFKRIKEIKIENWIS